MPVYTYKAYNPSGQVRTGIADADSMRDARLKLRRDGLMVTDISEIASITEKKSSRIGQWMLRRRTKGELPQVTRQLATLLGSGIPLNEGLKALVEQVETPQLEAVVRNVRESINQGASFAEAIEQHPAVFNKLYISMAKAGEAAGDLDAVLERLSGFMLKQSKTKNQVFNALMYPIIMMSVGAIVVAILMTKVVPKLIVLIESKGGAMPVPTQILKASSEFVSSYWYLIALAGVVFYMSWGATRRTSKGRLATDKILLRLPAFGDLFKKQAISRFAIALATLLKTGVPILEAITIVRELVGNAVLENVLDDLHGAILKGADIATPLKRSGVFPPAVGYMIAIGEQSGELASVLDRLAESYDQEVELATEKMTALIGPVLIMAMAGVVGFIVMAVVLPMLELGNA